MNDIETIVRGFQKAKKVPLTEIAKAVDRNRSYFYRLYAGIHVVKGKAYNFTISDEVKQKLNQFFKSYNYGFRI